MKVETKTIKTYKPSAETIMKHTGTYSVTEACNKLNVSQSTFRTWRTQGMSWKIAVKYFGEEYINNLED